jgi:hypothetical protein
MGHGTVVSFHSCLRFICIALFELFRATCDATVIARWWCQIGIIAVDK